MGNRSCHPCLRGHSDHHERSAKGTERGAAGEAGREAEAGRGVHPGGSGDGDCRRPATHPAEDQGKSFTDINKASSNINSAVSS